MDVKPEHILQGLGIIGATVVFSILFYAMSTPSPTPSPQAEINNCQNNAYQHIDGHLRIDEQEKIVASCSNAILGLNK